jgi:2-polyprenyl-3-methyl-5-hydroxy-6-metoxy-1,4-benzoquinol methylase
MSDVFTSEFHQKLHDDNGGYRRNNWLVDHAKYLKKKDIESVLEVGCGNGKFLHAGAKIFDEIVGVDWAESEELGLLPDNASFAKASILDLDFEENQFDLICSSDVLEHFPTEDLKGLVEKLIKSAKYNYHVIACYDDHKSHLTVWKPQQWLNIFHKIDPSFRMKDKFFCSRGDVCVITNM